MITAPESVFRVTRVRLSQPATVTASWFLDPKSTDTDSDHVFTLQRSGGPAGPWEDVTTFSVSGGNFPEDGNFELTYNESSVPGSQPRLYQITMTVLWRMMCNVTGVPIPFYTQPEILYENIKQNRLPDKVLRVYLNKIESDSRRTVDRVYGEYVDVLKVKRWGAPCQDCYDPDLEAVTRHNCDLCYGTGYEGGYWNKYRVPAIIGYMPDEDNQPKGTPTHGLDRVIAQIQIRDRVPIDTDDIVIDVPLGRAVRISESVYSEIGGLIIMSTVAGSVIGYHDSVYQLVGV